MSQERRLERRLNAIKISLPNYYYTGQQNNPTLYSDSRQIRMRRIPKSKTNYRISVKP